MIFGRGHKSGLKGVTPSWPCELPLLALFLLLLRVILVSSNGCALPLATEKRYAYLDSKRVQPLQ